MSTPRGDRQTSQTAVDPILLGLIEPPLAFADALVAVVDRRHQRCEQAAVVRAKKWLQRPVPVPAP